MKLRQTVVRVAVFAVSLMFLFTKSAFCQSHGDDKVGFKWGFAANVGPEGNRQFVPVRHDTIMHSGDLIKMVVELTKPCYVYVFYQGSNGELDLLFPYSLTQFTKDYSVGKNYFIPRGQDWDTLDVNTGKERIHVLASGERLTEFEVAYTKYKASNNSKDMARKVLAQISSTKRQYRTFASTIAERPINIGGNVRGLKQPESREPSVTDFEVGITSKAFYSKTFTIDHRK